VDSKGNKLPPFPAVGRPDSLSSLEGASCSFQFEEGQSRVAAASLPTRNLQGEVRQGVSNSYGARPPRVLIFYANPVASSFGSTLHSEVVTTLQSRGHGIDDAISARNASIPF
jgi:hypothetical protein